MKNFSPRTDLALEAARTITEANSNAEGIEIKEEDCHLPDTKVTWVKITNNKGAKAVGKPIGNYITLESPYLKINDPDAHEAIISLFSKYLIKLHDLDKDALVLVAGLGNSKVTPDSLGPKVISKILVTRHIKESLPVEINDSVRSVSAISPGVMGITGIETVEIIKGITEKISPDLIIAIDALAARQAERINSTIQMSDTGIAPGAGVGNRRPGLNKETLGIPVIAIGVPTVVDAATLVNDTLNYMLDSMIKETKNGSDFYKMLSDLNNSEKYELICHILDPYTENMFVTPKEVDSVINTLANIISNGINIALHPGIRREDINKFTY